MNIKPISNDVIVELLQEKQEEQKTESGIIIPSTAEEGRNDKGKVVAIGPGKTNISGTRNPMTVKVGDKILFNKSHVSSDKKIRNNGKEYFIVNEDSIIGIIKN